MLGRQKNRGDTIIEVLFAITVFSLVVVSGLSIMNQGSATAQRTLEISLVRQQIDAQAETLRFLNTSYVAAYQASVNEYPVDTPAGQWQLMHDSVVVTNNERATSFIANGSQCPTAPQGSFVLNARNATFVDPVSGPIVPSVTFSQIAYNKDDQVTNSEGLWIDAVRSKTSSDTNQSSAGYIDFNIRACWDSPGQDTPVTLGTVVRLYEPRG